MAIWAMASIWNNRPKFQLIPKIRLLSVEAPKDLVPGNLDHMEGTCLESAVDLLIPRPS
jgi:hypothetical protein